MATPDLAHPLPAVPGLLERLQDLFGVVAVVTGRRAEELRALLPVPGLEVFGLYGLERDDQPLEARVGWLRVVRSAVDRVAAAVPGARVEDKGVSLAVHYRQATDHVAALAALGPALAELASIHGLALLPGRMVLELAPAETPGKGFVVLRESRRHGLKGCLFAGDDAADLQAFSALDELESQGMETVRVAVASAEAPPALLDAADLVVDGPQGLVALLEPLARG